MKFSDKLAQLRKANNLSQEQLADKLDVSRQSVSKWESGDTYPDMAKLIQMCKVLNCSLPDLMDDGTFDESYKPKEKEKATFSSYINNFLDYVTKSYNMFIHMSLRSKLICLIEMACVAGVIALVAWLAPELLEQIFDKVFRYVPYGYTIAGVLSDIFAIALILIGIMVFFHIFKIRYLDYYVTIVDNTINEQVVEKPIEENATVSALDDKQKHEKVVIRDPKHSISHFLDGVGKIFSFIFKLFIVMCSLPALACAIGAAYLTTIMIVNISYSSVFTFAAISIGGCTIIGFIFVYMAINYIFKRKQPYTILIILFLSSLLMIGVGAGLATDKALNLKVVDDSYQIKYTNKEFKFNQDKIQNGFQLEFNCYDIERVIDDTVEGVIVNIEMPEDMDMTHGEYITDGDFKGEYYNFGYGETEFIHEINKIKNDIKNGYIRETYDGAHSLVRVKVVMSQETSDKVGIIFW